MRVAYEIPVAHHSLRDLRAAAAGQPHRSHLKQPLEVAIFEIDRLVLAFLVDQLAQQFEWRLRPEVFLLDDV